MTDELTIREITSKDPPTIAKAFRAQGWNKTRDQYEKYLLQQMEGRRTVLIAELNGEFVDHCGLQPCHVFHKEAQGVKGQSFTLEDLQSSVYSSGVEFSFSSCRFSL